MRRTIVLIPVLLGPAACQEAPGSRGVSREPPPAAAVMAPGPQAARLPEQLDRLIGEIEAARAGDPDRLLTAEAITDQLIHAPRDVDWLATGYDIEARLRQLQALADGIVARLRRGSTLGQVEGEVELLLTSARDLQAQLARPGGGRRPPPLEALLAQDPLRDVGAASLERGASGAAQGRARGQPLGTPVDPPDGG